MKDKWVYDLETLNIFTATFRRRDGSDLRQFVIAKHKDEREELFKFLNEEVSGLIGYNCIHFDAQILEYMFRYPNCTVQEIRSYAEIITFDNDRRPDVPEWKLRIPHLDLFRALSLSTKAKRTSLKWCEFSLDLDNIEDLPSQGDGNNWEEQVLSYNDNDVLATLELYKAKKYEIELREAIIEKEKVNVLNSTEPDIAKKLFAKWLHRDMKISRSDLMSMGTDRKLVNVKDIILPYADFQTTELQDVKESFEKLSLEVGDKFDKSINYKGIKLDYGLGGLHGVVPNSVFESNEEYIIKSSDVISFYPNLAIRNNLHPAHIPANIFSNLYEGLFNERRKIPKSNPMNYVYKICLNSLYGLTNDKFSFLRDRQFTVAICVNGQLLLSMLFEDLLLEVPNSKLLMVNTDGFEMMIPRKYSEKYLEVCKKWEIITNLELEHEDYDKLIIKDVNNYISIFSNGKTKCKGFFEFEDIPLYKNKSYSIIPRAIFEYFVNNIPVEKTIRDSRNIFEFCAGVKAAKSGKKGRSWFELHSLKNGELHIQKLSKTVRYFISTKGSYLIKRFEDESYSQAEAPKQVGKFIKDWKVTYFNKKFDVKNFKDYNIDYSYYISKSKEVINQIEDKQQLKLF